ncbi:MAG: hypothetical protein HY758_10215 [Nitrospirae bacterium]|nr:hypothetical protein [Nitrospirota bacterium]
MKKSHKKKTKKRRPKNVWNSLRKLEGYLKKADIQANIFMDSLYELKEKVSFDIKRDMVNELCNSVDGDILHALHELNNNIDVLKTKANEEQLQSMVNLYETITRSLNITPFRYAGERFSLRKPSVKKYKFDEYPESLDVNSIDEFEVEVLRCGWKMADKIIIKPVVFEVENTPED